jgi:hypothetical protein
MLQHGEWNTDLDVSFYFLHVESFYRNHGGQSSHLPPGRLSSRSAAGTVEVTGSTVNLRSGPGTGNPVLGTVRRGDRLPIPGESGNWFQIRLPYGRRGGSTTSWSANGNGPIHQNPKRRMDVFDHSPFSV